MKTKKRIIAVLMATLIVLSLSLPVLAFTSGDATYSFSRGEYRYYGSTKQERCNVKLTAISGNWSFHCGWLRPNGTTTGYGSWKTAYQGFSATAYSGYVDCPNPNSPTF